MAYPNEVPDDQKEGDHLAPVDKWPEIRAEAERIQRELADAPDDIEVPDDDEDDPVEQWPDEVSRDETLDGSRR